MRHGVSQGHTPRAIHQRNICDKWFSREACFDLGDVKVEMKRRMKTFSWRKDLKLNEVEVKTLSWRKDLKLNAARCFSGTRATVRSTEETVVISGSNAKPALTRTMSKWRKTL